MINTAFILGLSPVVVKIYQRGHEMIVVPRLDEAPFFDLMVCFTKPGNKTALEKVSNFIKGEYDFQLRGHLTDLIDRSSEGSNLSKTLLACKNTVKADVDKESLSHEWMSPDGNKLVEIKLDGLSKEVISWATLNEGDLVFDIDLSGRKRMNLHYFRGCLRIKNLHFV